MNKQSSSILVEDLVKVYQPSPVWMRALVRSNITEPVHALRGISFEVSPGEICVVLGPNGAGKTTTFRTLVGLTTPSSGTVRVVGHDPETEALEVRRLVGWMPGDHRSLLMRHSVEENLRFHGKLQGISNHDLPSAVRESLELVGLERRASSTCFALSAGMRARLQLARALLHRPKVLILDEPTGAVDPVASNEIVELILSIVSEREIAALISSHRLEEIERLHTRVLLLDRGRLRWDGPLDELRSEFASSRLEIAFRTAEEAVDAELALKRANLGRFELNGDATVACLLDHDVSTAQVLETLGPRSAGIISLQDTEPPLQAVLANIYQTGIDREDEVSDG